MRASAQARSEEVVGGMGMGRYRRRGSIGEHVYRDAFQPFVLEWVSARDCKRWSEDGVRRDERVRRTTERQI